MSYNSQIITGINKELFLKTKYPGSPPKYFANLLNLPNTPGKGLGVYILLNDLGHLARANCPATFADGEFQTFFHRDRLNQDNF